MLRAWGECYWTAADIRPRPVADTIWCSGAIEEIAVCPTALDAEQISDRHEERVALPLWRVVASTLLTQALLITLAVELWIMFFHPPGG